MDPCPFVRLLVDSLAVKLKIKNLASQTVLLPLCSAADVTDNAAPPEFSTSATGFHLDRDALNRLRSRGKPVMLNLKVYAGRMGKTCGIRNGKLVGEVRVCVNLEGAEARPVVFQKGWTKLGTSEPDRPVARLHLAVRSEPDPRFVFQFGGEPESSPVVFQIQGNIRQPVFSCKFSADRNARSRSLPSDFTLNNNRGWMTPGRDKPGRERKGWMIVIHDLSGSCIAAASMITPFVPSPGSDRVSRSNPGAWLILRPHGFSFSSWKPWGRLEAWRERGTVDGLGYRFELVNDSCLTSTTPIVEGTMDIKKGGTFCIDNTVKNSTLSSFLPIRGFVMSSSVEGEGKTSKPMVQVGVQHVTCMADAALFVALSAAIDLSVDACRLFSRKLTKEFWHDEQEYLS